MDWGLLGSLVGLLGGLEGVKYFFNRRAIQRSTNAAASADEFRSLREYNEFLQQELKQVEERFTSQTERLREVQRRELELTRECSKLSAELYLKRCEWRGCPNREPQNEY